MAKVRCLFDDDYDEDVADEPAFRSHSLSNWLIRKARQSETGQKMWRTIMRLRPPLRFKFDESPDVETLVLTDSFF